VRVPRALSRQWRQFSSGGFFSVMAEKIVLNGAKKYRRLRGSGGAGWRARECRRRKERCAGFLVFGYSTIAEDS